MHVAGARRAAQPQPKERTWLGCIQGFHLARPLPAAEELEPLFGSPEPPRRRPAHGGQPWLPQRS